MTTIVGIKSNYRKEGVVLASDLSRTQSKWTAQGDVAYREQTRSEGQKIHVDNSREVALAMSGIFDNMYAEFLGGVLRGKIKVADAIEKEFFDELVNLNLRRWDGRTPDASYLNSLVLAVRYNNKPRLYTCWPLGKIEEREWTAIGSGANFALDYISSDQDLLKGKRELKRLVGLSVNALDKSSQDIYTSGADMAVILPDRIVEFGKEFRRHIEAAKKTSIKNAVKQIS